MYKSSLKVSSPKMGKKYIKANNFKTLVWARQNSGTSRIASIFKSWGENSRIVNPPSES